MAVESFSASTPPLRPRLRAVEITAFVHQGEEYLHFHDRSGLAPDTQVPRGLAPILGLMDGTRDIQAMAVAIELRHGETVDRAFLEKLVSELDELHLLDSPRYRAHRQAVEAEFNQSPIRPAAFAGRSYPGTEHELRFYMDRLRAGGEALFPAKTDLTYEPAQVRGIVVPHIDFGRGGKEEALAYLPLLQNVAETGRPFDTLVTFGIAHSGVEYPFCAAPKDYETPLGTAHCDRDFVAELEARLGPRLTAEQYAHKHEHSVEFVADFTQYFDELKTSKLVPIICGGFWGPTRGQYSPLLDADIAGFITALKEVTAEHEARGKKIGFIASVDGAHVGSNFGDDTLLTTSRLREIEFADRQWAAAIEAGDAEALHAHFAQDENRFNVDAHPAVYTLLAAFPSWRGQLLAYNQAYDAPGNSVVSFASLVLFEPSG
jgi:hypothetical protein